MGLTEIATWLRSNLLTLNTTKSNYICFSPSQRSQPGADFIVKMHVRENCSNNCDCQYLQQVSSTKYLGIIVDQRLSWHPHIELLMKRVRKFIWIFKTLRYLMSPRLLNKIYTALTQSVITYCITVWGGASKIKFLDLERAQRSLIKVMYFKPFRFPTVDLYRISDLLSVRRLYILYVTMTLHKSIPYDPDTQKRRRKDIVAHSPGIRTVFARRQYGTQSAYLYNKINFKLNIYPLQLYDCKNIIIKWLNTLSYDQTEDFLIRTS